MSAQILFFTGVQHEPLAGAGDGLPDLVACAAMCLADSCRFTVEEIAAVLSIEPADVCRLTGMEGNAK